MQINSRLLRKLILVFATLMFIGACDRTRPIFEVHNHTVPSSNPALTLSEVEAKIVRAGNSLGWEMNQIKPGLIHGTIKWRNHSGTVRIVHDTTKFSILYQSSVRLKQGIGIAGTPYEGQRVIHKLYNKHVMTLQRRIESYLRPEKS